MSYTEWTCALRDPSPTVDMVSFDYYKGSGAQFPAFTRYQGNEITETITVEGTTANLFDGRGITPNGDNYALLKTIGNMEDILLPGSRAGHLHIVQAISNPTGTDSNGHNFLQVNSPFIGPANGGYLYDIRNNATQQVGYNIRSKGDLGVDGNQVAGTRTPLYINPQGIWTFWQWVDYNRSYQTMENSTQSIARNWPGDIVAAAGQQDVINGSQDVVILAGWDGAGNTRNWLNEGGNAGITLVRTVHLALNTPLPHKTIANIVRDMSSYPYDDSVYLP